MTKALSDADRLAGLQNVPRWTYDEASASITRAFEFKDFSEAFGFMSRVALLAESAGHHPDWSNSYNKVTIVLSTHDAGGSSQKDLDLAAQIDALVP